MKTYLGDGIYVERDPYNHCFILTTENGMEVTNEIVLEVEVWRLLKQFVEAYF